MSKTTKLDRLLDKIPLWIIYLAALILTLIIGICGSYLEWMMWYNFVT